MGDLKAMKPTPPITPVPEASRQAHPTKTFRRRRLLPPPERWDPALIDLVEEGGLLALSYHCIDELRRRPRLTEEQKRQIAEHDEVERRIKEEPQELLYEASQMLDDGMTKLLKLARSKRLETCHRLVDGSVFSRDDEAIARLSLHQERMHRELVRLADAGHPSTEAPIFSGAKMLAEAFIRLAQQRPEDFIRLAKRSAVMPSLRCRHPDYTADAATIAKAIHLGEDHPAPDIQDNRSRAGAFSHALVADILERIQSAREEYLREEEHLARMKAFEETAEEYREVTVEEELRSRCYPDRFEHVMACGKLGDLRDDAGKWWKTRVLPMVKEAFAELAKRPQSKPSLWEELGHGGEINTLNDRRRYLEKLCRNKFDQIAKGAHRMPAHGQAG